MPIMSIADYRNAPGRTAHWTGSVAGAYALQWEQQQIDLWVSDIFGYHALQLGLPDVAALQANRMPNRWVLHDVVHPEATAGQTLAPAAPEGAPQTPGGTRVWAEFHALPFPSQSVDLVVMPHTLELTGDPHQTLREVDRVLRPEGRLLITGFNPASLWGLWRRSGRAGLPLGRPSGPVAWAGASAGAGDWVGYWRLRDWLRLLSFEVEGGRFGCYVPPVSSARWLERTRWMEPMGDRWWPVLGSVYAVMAVKRVRGMRLVGLSRSAARVKTPAPAVVTQRHRRSIWPDDPSAGRRDG